MFYKGKNSVNSNPFAVVCYSIRWPFLSRAFSRPLPQNLIHVSLEPPLLSCTGEKQEEKNREGRRDERN
jgi:hypothetical protein